MTPQSIKLNNKKEAKACVEALKAFGFFEHEECILYEKGTETLWLSRNNKIWFVFDHHARAEDQKEFDNWKDFAAEILKNYTYKVKSAAEKEWFIKSFDLASHVFSSSWECYSYFYWDKDIQRFSFNSEYQNKPQKTITQIKTLLEPMKKETIALKVNNAAEAEEYSNTLKELGVPFDKFLPYYYQTSWGSSPRDFLMMRDDCFFTGSLPHSHYLCENFDEFLNKLPQKYKKNMKTEKNKVEITTQEAAYLCAILNRGEDRRKALKEQKCEFMLTFENDNWFEVWDKFNNVFEKEGKGTWNCYNSQHLFKPQIKEFVFSNGFETTSESSGKVSIGCQTNSKEGWLADVNSIIALDLQEVKKEGYIFTKADVEGFRSWLIGE